MTKRLRRITILVFLLFFLLFISSTLLQTVFAGSLQADARNTRTTLDSYQVQRGAIRAGDVTLAESTPVDSIYRFERQYPAGQAYSQIVGYFSQQLASTGIESAENVALSGADSTQFLDRLSNTVNGTTPHGSDVELTIDPAVQQAAWDALGDHKGAAVALDPKTGKILAMVSKPSYDAVPLASNDFAAAKAAYEALNADAGQPLVNRAIAGDTYPPGSTFKLIVSAAALEHGYTPDSTFANPAALTLTGTQTQIRNVSLGPCGGRGSTVSIRVALQYSCNIPFAELGAELGYDTINQTAQAFGFGQDISIPLAVTASRFPQTESTAQLQLASFGEASVRATPLQMALVSAGIANGGTVMTPQLVDQVRSPDLQTTQQFSARSLSQAIKPETATTLTQMMVNNVASGEISGATIDGVDVAGKTGTAETTKQNQYDLWFTGFAPANDPKVAVAVVTEEGGEYGNSLGSNRVAAPIAQQIMKAVLQQ